MTGSDHTRPTDAAQETLGKTTLFSHDPRKWIAPMSSVPMVGRDAELETLQNALSDVLTLKSPRIVTLLGAPGIGKTRLVDEFLARAIQRSHRGMGRKIRVLRGLGRTHGPTLGLIQRLLEQRFDLHESMSVESIADKFRQEVTATLGDRRVTEFLHFLGRFLDIRFPDSPFLKAFDEGSAEYAQLSRVMLRRFFELDAMGRPLVITCEELHWGSPDLLDIVQYLIQTLQDAPILLICSARPELSALRPEWGQGAGHHSLIELSPLDATSARTLAKSLLSTAAIDPTCDDVIDRLVDKAVEVGGGSPYLLEQVVHAFVATGTLSLGNHNRWEVDNEKLQHVHVPFTIDDAVTARMGALTPAERSLLEVAATATAGGVFWLGSLVAVGRMGTKAPILWGGAEDLGAQYKATLQHLVEREYVIEMPSSLIPGEVEYSFKHHLEREALLRFANPTKQISHALVIARWLEFRLVHRAEEHCEILAQHYEHGGAYAKAARYHLLGAQRAKARYANYQATEFFENALRLFGDEETFERLDALHGYGDVLQLLGRNDDALQVFKKMLDLAFHFDLKAKGGVAHNRIGRVYRAVGKLDDAMRHLGTGHALFDACEDVRGVASSLDDIGKVHWMRGAYEQAGRFIQEALEMRKRLGDSRSIALSYNNLGLVYQDSGRFALALEAFHEALRIEKDSGDIQGMSQTLNNLGMMHQDRGDDRRALELWNEALSYAREVGDRARQAVIYTNLGEAYYRLKQPKEAIEYLTQAEQLSSLLGDRLLEAEILRGLAKAYSLASDIHHARQYIDRSLQKFEISRSKPFLGLAYRTFGEVVAEGIRIGASAPSEAQKVYEAFERSILYFEELGNDIERARSMQALASFLVQAKRKKMQLLLTVDDDTDRYVQRLQTESDSVLDRLKKVNFGLNADDNEPTEPNIRSRRVEA